MSCIQKLKYPPIPGVDDYKAPDEGDWKDRMRAYLKEEAECGDELLSDVRRQRLKQFLSSKRFKGLVLSSFREFVDAELPGHMDVGRLEAALRHLQGTLQSECLKQVLLVPTDLHADTNQHDIRFTTEELAEWMLSIGHDPREQGHITLAEFHYLAQTMVFTFVTLHRVHTIAARKRSEALRPTLLVAAAATLAIAGYYLLQMRKRRNAKPPPMPASLKAKLALPGSAGSTGGLLPHTSRVLPVFRDGAASMTGTPSGQAYLESMQGGQGTHAPTRGGADGYDGEADDDEGLGAPRSRLGRPHRASSTSRGGDELVAPLPADPQHPPRSPDWLEQQALERHRAASRRGGGRKGMGGGRSGVDPSDC